MTTVASSCLASRLLACGLTIVALGLAPLSAYAQDSLSYIFVGLDSTGTPSATAYGSLNNNAYGAAYIPSAGQPHAVGWDLSTGTRFDMDRSGLYRSVALGAVDGYAFGNATYRTQGVNQLVENTYAAAWNLSNNSLVSLNNSGFESSYAVGITNGYVVGTGRGYATGNNNTAFAWDLSTGARTALNNTGLEYDTSLAAAGDGYGVGYGRGTSTGNTNQLFAWNISTGVRTSLTQTATFGDVLLATGDGYATGYTRSANYSTAAAVWNLSTGAYSTLNNTGLSNSTAMGTANGYAVGLGNLTSGGAHAMGWDIATNTRTDLQTNFLPVGTSRSSAYGIDKNGVVTGAYDDSSSAVIPSKAFALVPFKASTGDTLRAGVTAKVSGNLTQNTGVTTINGNYIFMGGAGKNTYTQAGGVLQGIGSISGNVVNMGGILAVGNLPGSLTINGDYTQGAGGVMNIALFDLANFDPLLVTGNTTLAGTLNFALDPNFTGMLPDYVDLINTEGLLTGTFDNVNLIGNMPSGMSGYSLSTVSNGGSGNIVRLNVVKAVPETGTLLLMGLPILGLASLTVARTRRK